jgi:hypothetical protein
MSIITPETTNYLIAGYAVFFGVFIFFIISMAVRWSHLKRDLQSLQEMEKDKKS